MYAARSLVVLEINVHLCSIKPRGKEKKFYLLNYTQGQSANTTFHVSYTDQLSPDTFVVQWFLFMS